MGLDHCAVDCSMIVLEVVMVVMMIVIEQNGNSLSGTFYESFCDVYIGYGSRERCGGASFKGGVESNTGKLEPRYG